MRAKTIPAPTLATISPPNEEYSCFEGSHILPFKFILSNYELVNASWLADAALLAYDLDEVFVRKQYAAAGMQQFQPFRGLNTQCYVASNDDFAIVSFRGTRVLRPGQRTSIRDVVEDLLVDSRFVLVDWEYGGSVHEGFKAALDQLWAMRNGVKPYLEFLSGKHPELSVWFTGHSMGAALATLAAQRYDRSQGLYTYGSPLVGDKAFARAFTVSNTVRFVNNNDFVTRIPPTGRYKTMLVPWSGRYEHVGIFHYINPDGVIVKDPGPATRFADRFNGYLSRTQELLDELVSKGIVGVPDDDLVDHAPLYYATYLWNSCIRTAK